MAVSVAIFDYKTLFDIPPHRQSEVRDLLAWLAKSGVRIVVFSTDAMDVSGLAADSGFQTPDLHVSARDVAEGKKRGSPNWVDAVTENFGVARHELVYIGSTALDWRTAINSGVIYVHAGWAAPQPYRTTSLVASKPAEVRELAQEFLLPGPSTTFNLNDPSRSMLVRALLPASVRLSSTSPNSTFTLQDIFTYDRRILVGEDDARSVLMLRLLCSIYTEGLLAPNALFAVYPSSTPGKVSEQLQGYLQPAASLVHGFFKPDLLVRAVQATDTSLERYRARQEGRLAKVDMTTQANSVHVNPVFRGKLQGKTVFVFDDFTTTGMSLEWARLLLLSAGAEHIRLITVGKYSARYSAHELVAGKVINPFAVNQLSASDFSQQPLTLAVDGSAESKVAAMFRVLATRP